MLCLLHTISQELRIIDCEFNNAKRNKHLRIELRSDDRFLVTAAVTRVDVSVLLCLKICTHHHKTDTFHRPRLYMWKSNVWLQ